MPTTPTTTILLMIDQQAYAIVQVDADGCVDLPVNPDRGPLRGRVTEAVAFLRGFADLARADSAVVSADGVGISAALVRPGTVYRQPWQPLEARRAA